MRFDRGDYGLQRIYVRNFVDRKVKCTSRSHLKGPIVSWIGGSGYRSIIVIVVCWTLELQASRNSLICSYKMRFGRGNKKVW